MRTTTLWNDNWSFMKNAADAAEAVQKCGAQEAEQVMLPHTWNAVDGQNGGNDYYRGTCWYVKGFTKNSLAEAGYNGEGRIFIEFGGAAMSAVVTVNGTKAAEHRGGYSAFRVDLTDLLLQDGDAVNTIAVSVCNEDNDTVYPQKADFTFYGGLYRDVKLIAVPEEHFELEYCGSPAIRVTPQICWKDENGSPLAAPAAEGARHADAKVTVETWSRGGAAVRIRLLDAEGNAVAGDEGEVFMRMPSENGHAQAVLTIPDVHLWDGLADPYLYTAQALLFGAAGEDGEVSKLDEIRTRFGCRTVAADPDKGFLLNGRVYPLRGVSRHQDLKGKGNALSLEDHRRDMEIIREIGANTLRLAHYQHAQEFYDLCDENGIVVWAEIPYITKHMTNGHDNTISQMKELIVQNYNHACIAVWGLSNEITAASVVNEELLENHRELNDLCHRMDATRMTTMAHAFMLEIESPILEIPDVNSYNLYFGWYLGELEQNDEFFDEYHEKYPDRVIGFSEYGADANPQYQSAHPERSDYTESYQAVYHEHMLKLIADRPYLWATHVWNLFDFAADGRDEGGKNGENQKGLVTFDRSLKKDAFYLYKAAWNKTEPFVHLCGRRYVNRAEETTEIKVYSNCPVVTLYVDGKEAGQIDNTGAAPGTEVIFRFEVPITGEHEILAKAEDGICDTMKIRKVQDDDPAYIFGEKKEVVNWFDQDEIDPEAFSVQDTLGALRAHPKAGAVVNAMMEKATAARGDVAESVKDNPALQKMMAKMTLISLLKQAGADEETVKNLNRVLQAIRKDS